MSKIAIVTGAGRCHSSIILISNNRNPGSGIGLASAQALASRSGWKVYILDFNTTAGEAAAAQIGPSASFIQVDITNYKSLANSFKTIFQLEKRLDFVFANAGIGERATFYTVHDTGIEPPPECPELTKVVDVVLNGVINTAYLARHYFRLTPDDVAADKSLVITASCGAFYPSYYSPIYTAAKHGVLGFMRSIAPIYYKEDKIRVNAVCPGTVKTNLLSSVEWAAFPTEYFTPVEKIVEAVLIFVDGKDTSDKGRDVGVMNSKAIECSGRNHYYREQYEYCDEPMKLVMQSTERTSF